MTSSDRSEQPTYPFEIGLGVHMQNFSLKMKSSYDNYHEVQFRVHILLVPPINFLLFTPVLYDPIYKSTHFLLLSSTAGTKNSVQRCIADICARSPRTLSSGDSGLAEQNPHRYWTGTRARMEIRKWHYRPPERFLIRICSPRSLKST